MLPPWGCKESGMAKQLIHVNVWQKPLKKKKKERKKEIQRATRKIPKGHTIISGINLINERTAKLTNKG